jgi:tetratricopeptide (TPR) repeat protein
MRSSANNRPRLLAKLVRAGWACAAMALGGGAAADPMNPATASAGELSRLPDYCNHVWGYYRDAGERANWFARMGPVFEHMHHYCWGMLKANRAAAPGISPTMRRTLYASAVQECHYVLRNNPDPAFVLRPEIFYRMGQWEAANESWVQAMEYYRQSIATKADYWPPYVGIAEIEMKLARRDRAIAVLDEGLKFAPDEPRLKEAMARARESRLRQ